MQSLCFLVSEVQLCLPWDRRCQSKARATCRQSDFLRCLVPWALFAKLRLSFSWKRCIGIWSHECTWQAISVFPIDWPGDSVACSDVGLLKLKPRFACSCKAFTRVPWKATDSVSCLSVSQMLVLLSWVRISKPQATMLQQVATMVQTDSQCT